MEGKTDVRMFTNIHTRINSKYRISTIFRKYGNINFTSWAWETIVWRKDDDNERIIEQETSNNLSEVLEKHESFFEKYQS
ncbi:hypothetical protein [Gracilibacillus thailandensis]|uniref:Uncharacterized protein n=1 Tax=Gracilibacillus thailandensis TaxID=563735 RepID=A0A6N7QUA2_9BACI|nr:hypothetical protein [Gracilibacillus thailandensis]MRI65114.1 hypothetical protein [Gracilibacillus thailandensis]